jgi:hypothetical protein
MALIADLRRSDGNIACAIKAVVRNPAATKDEWAKSRVMPSEVAIVPR